MGLEFPLEKLKKENSLERVVMVAAQCSTECYRDGHNGSEDFMLFIFTAIKGIRASCSITFLSSSKDI